MDENTLKFQQEALSCKEESRLEDVTKQILSKELNCEIYKERYTDGLAMLEQCGGKCNSIIEAKVFRTKSFSLSNFVNTLTQACCYVNNLGKERNVKFPIISTNRGMWTGIVPQSTLNGLKTLVDKYQVSPSKACRVFEIREYMYKEVYEHSLYKIDGLDIPRICNKIKTISIEWK